MKKVILLYLFLFPACLALLGAGGNSETEPNNTWDQANPISINSYVTGSIGIDADYEDWFVFTIPSYGQITFTAIPESTLNINIEMFDSNGTTFIKGSSVAGETGESNVLVYPNLKAGTYYLKTTRYSSTYGSYTIENVFEPTAIPDGNDYEPNDTWDQAQEITINTPVTGNIGYYGSGHTDSDDWFVFTIPSYGQITFTAIPESTLNINIEMFDSNGTTFIKNSSVAGETGENNVLVYPNLKEGTYYLRTTRYSSTYGSYTIENLFEPTAIPDGNDEEPNDTWDKAQEIFMNTPVTGNIGYYGNGHTDSDDWFVFTIPSYGQITFTAIPESTLNINIEMFDSNGTTFIKSSSVAGETGENNVLVYPNLKEGTYYLRTTRYSSTYGSYTIENVFEPTAIPDGNDEEPNDTWDQAQEISLNTPVTGHIGFYGNGHIDINDWFSVQIDNPGEITIEVDPESTLDISVFLYDVNGTTYLKGCDVCGGTGEITSLQYNITTAGKYYINLSRASSTYGSYTLNAFSGSGPAPVMAAFSAHVTSGEAPLMVVFADLSTGSPTQWEWDFGDGNTSALQNPEHTYADAGTYTVQLTASRVGSTDTETKTGYIIVTAPGDGPGPGTGVTWEEDFEGSYVLPDGWTVFDEDNDGDYWGISISQNHTPGGGRSAYHFYGSGMQKGWLITPPIDLPAGNTYSLSFWSYNTFPGDYGKNSLLVSTDTNTPGNDFTELWSPASVSQSWVETTVDLTGFAGETIYLAFCYEGDFAHAWYLDDIKITSEGAADGMTAAFSADVTTGQAPLTVTFTDSSTGSPSMWNWDFGDGGTSDKQNPGYTYNEAGTYTVTLTVSGGGSVSSAVKENYIVVDEPGSVPDGIADIDGNVYDSVRIGNQTWFASNLKVTRFNNGDEISIVEDGTGWGEVEPVHKWAYYNNDAANNDLYGKLYNGNVATDEMNVCPDGWRVATDDDWNLLIEYLGGIDVAGNKLMDIQAWANPNNATNESGFSALPGGYRSDWGNFLSLTYSASFYTSTTPQSWSTSHVTLNQDGTILLSTSLGGGAGRSIRCIKDAGETASAPVVMTTPVTEITTGSARSGGNITGDGGAAVSARGVVWCTSENPDLNNNVGQTNDGEGDGVFISDLSGLAANTLYYVRAWATNSAGTGFGEPVSFTTADDPVGDIVTDINGNEYQIITIGNQVWFAENLRATRYSDGSDIPVIISSEEWENEYSGAMSWYNNDDGNKDLYGGLYNFYTVESAKLCPEGWRVPDDGDWKELEIFLGMSVTAADADNWRGTDQGSQLKSGDFAALLAGVRMGGGDYHGLGTATAFWTSTYTSHTDAYYRYLENNRSTIFRASQSVKRWGHPVRCIEGVDPQPAAVTTSDVTFITDASASAGGEVTFNGWVPVIARGVVWGISENPTLEANSGFTLDGDRMGLFESEITGLVPATTYYLRAYVTNSEGTSYGDQISFATLQEGTVADGDGNIYNIIRAGTQYWLSENLRTAKLNDGTAITEITGNNSWTFANNAAYCWYSNDVNFKDTPRGALYNWHAVNTGKLCPAGFKVPSTGDWDVLIEYVGENGAAKLKATEGWGTNGTDDFDFSALPAGMRSGANGMFFSDDAAFWWTSDDKDGGSTAHAYLFYNHSSSVSTGDYNKRHGHSVRCVGVEAAQDPDPNDPDLSAPEVSTATVSDITSSTAVSGGNITSDGGAPVTARGIVWSISENPTTDNNDGKTTDGDGTGEFTSNIGGLESSTLYYVRAYATNSEGTAYGDQVSFTTLVTGLEFISEGKMTVFPNPFSDMAVIASERGIEKVVMHNISGQAVLERTVSGSNQMTINVEHLSKGVYLMTVVETGGRITIIKLIK
jgi:uncharacterized protein (TIGR02145 family)